MEPTFCHKMGGSEGNEEEYYDGCVRRLKGMSSYFTNPVLSLHLLR